MDDGPCWPLLVPFPSSGSQESPGKTLARYINPWCVNKFFYVLTDRDSIELQTDDVSGGISGRIIVPWAASAILHNDIDMDRGFGDWLH